MTTYESLVYFSLYCNNKKLKTSSWQDVRDLYDSEDSTMQYFKNSIVSVCKEYNLDADLSSDDLDEWKLI
jgi:hypothetical protein